MATLESTVEKRGKIPRGLILRRWLYARLTAFPQFVRFGQGNWKDNSLLYRRASLFGVPSGAIKFVAKEMGVFDTIENGSTDFEWSQYPPDIFCGRTNGVIASQVRVGLQELFVKYPCKIPYEEWKKLQTETCSLTVFKKIAYDLGFREAGCKDGLIDSWPSFFLDVVDYRKRNILNMFVPIDRREIEMSIYDIVFKLYCKSHQTDRGMFSQRTRQNYIDGARYDKNICDSAMQSLDAMITDAALAELCLEGFLTCDVRVCKRSGLYYPDDRIKIRPTRKDYIERLVHGESYYYLKKQRAEYEREKSLSEMDEDRKERVKSITPVNDRLGETIEFYQIAPKYRYKLSIPDDMYYERSGFDYQQWRTNFLNLRGKRNTASDL